MSALSRAYATTLLNTALRSDTLYLALFLTDPGPTGGGVEVSGGGYARTAITMGPPAIEVMPEFPEGVEVCSNNASIMFPTATGSWGSVAYWAVFDANDNMRFYGPFTRYLSIGVGGTILIPPGELKVALG